MLIELQNTHDRLVNSQKQLVQASKFTALWEMASGIAHEINNPLFIISGKVLKISRLYKDDTDEVRKEEANKFAEDIKNLVTRISKIIDNLRRFAREENSHQELLNLKCIIENSMSFYRERMEQNGIQIKEEIDDGLTFSGERNQMIQIILNFINNSFYELNRTEGREKWIFLRGYKLNNEIILTIKDSGLGLPPEVSEKVFNPFFTTKPVGEGTGLGLSVSKGVIESLGGSLKYKEYEINTTFEIKLPLTNGSKTP
jgi:C4-dicarboxylate-specific signal transduction histidine kinase